MTTFKEILGQFDKSFRENVTSLMTQLIPEEQKVEIPSNNMSSFSNAFEKIYACNHAGEASVLGISQGVPYKVSDSMLSIMDMAIIGDAIYDGARSILTDQEIDEINNCKKYGDK